MKLNSLEKKVVSHPLRFWIQQKVEAPLLLSLFESRPVTGGRVLEVGCGYGEGIALIQSHFSPASVVAVDLDAHQVQQVSRRYQEQPQVQVDIGDATCLTYANASFDLVCNFAVFHHIPDWQQAVAEVYRVLKPGGYFLLEDLYRWAICNPVSKRLFIHPQENRFDHAELLAEIRFRGFEVVNHKQLLNLSGMVLARKPLVCA